MKKIIAAFLCLGFLTTPSFACSDFGYHRGPNKFKQPPRIEKYHYQHNCHNRCYNRSTATLATIAGIAGLAAIVAAAAN